MKRKVLVVDIGGTHVKLLMSLRNKREFESGPAMTPQDFVAKMKETAGGWKFDAISIGFPSVVLEGRIVKDPKHLGPGWAGFNFKALGKPVRVINDAAMQALGSYHGRRMLFLGLGTGLGSALVWKRNLLPLELGDLPYRDRQIIEEWLGIPGLQRLGETEWKDEVLYAVAQLKRSFIADYVVLGPGENENAYRGGLRLWEDEPGSREPKWHIL
jgi:polyphosphate glucokinase